MAWCLLVGVTAPRSLLSQPDFHWVVTEKTRQFSTLSQASDTALLSPFDKRHLFPKEEGGERHFVWDGSNYWEEWWPDTGNVAPTGLSVPWKVITHGGGMSFFFDNTDLDFQLPWSSDDQKSWQDQAWFRTQQKGGVLLSDTPFPTSAVSKQWGAIYQKATQTVVVSGPEGTSTYTKTPLAMMHQSRHGDSLYSMGFAPVPGGFSLAYTYQRLTHSGSSGACWTTYTTTSYGAPQDRTPGARILASENPPTKTPIGILRQGFFEGVPEGISCLSFEITDILGRLWARGHCPLDSPLPVGHWPPGMYIVRWHLAAGIKEQKLIINTY